MLQNKHFCMVNNKTKKMNKGAILLWILILKSFYTNAQLATSEDNTEYGIAQKIDATAKQFKLGNIHSESSKMRPTAGKGGWFLRYEKGWVYYNPKTNNTYAIWGEVMKKWSTNNYETGWLGFPLSNNSNTPNRQGAFVHFDKGSIYYSPNTGAHWVGGAFKEYWKNKGWENSAELGFPKTDEVEIFINGYTRYQQFEKGTLFWGANKTILYSNNPHATTPPIDNIKTLSFAIKNYGQYEDDIPVGTIELYGWMDIRIYKAEGVEVMEADGKSFSLFNIEKRNAETAASFTLVNTNNDRHYNVSETDIQNNAYVRITYWLNDKDDVSSDDYLKLNTPTNSWKYNGGNHPYREIKLKEIVRRNNNYTNKDNLKDGTDEISITYNLTIK